MSVCKNVYYPSTFLSHLPTIHYTSASISIILSAPHYKQAPTMFALTITYEYEISLDAVVESIVHSAPASVPENTISISTLFTRIYSPKTHDLLLPATRRRDDASILRGINNEAVYYYYRNFPVIDEPSARSWVPDNRHNLLDVHLFRDTWT